MKYDRTELMMRQCASAAAAEVMARLGRDIGEHHGTASRIAHAAAEAAVAQFAGHFNAQLAIIRAADQKYFDEEMMRAPQMPPPV